MHFSLFHKMLIVLVVLNVGGLLLWNEKNKSKNKIAALEKEAKKWLDREIRILYKILITTNKEIIESEPILPTAKVTSTRGGNTFIVKRTSLSNAERFIDTCMSRGYFKARMVSIPTKDISKIEIVPVHVAMKQVSRAEHTHVAK